MGWANMNALANYQPHKCGSVCLNGRHVWCVRACVRVCVRACVQNGQLKPGMRKALLTFLGNSAHCAAMAVTIKSDDSTLALALQVRERARGRVSVCVCVCVCVCV